MRSKIQKWGNSLALRIPKTFAVEQHIAEGTVVDISVRAGELVVAVAEREYTLEELVAGITDANRHEEFDFGAPAGDEAW